MSDAPVLTIRQALRLRREHGIPMPVMNVIGNLGAQKFANMTNEAQIILFLDQLCPEDADPSTYPIDPADIPGIIDNIMKNLEAVRITPMAAVLAQATAPAAPTQQTENLYRKVIFREWTLEQAEAAGLNLYIGKRTLLRMAGLVEVYILLATGFIDGLANDPEDAFSRMGLMGVSGEAQDAIHQWLSESKMNAGRNRWYTAADLATMFAKMEGFFGNAWISFMQIVAKFTDTIDAHAMLGGIGQANLQEFKGLGRLKNDFPLMAEEFGRKAEQGTLIAAARQPITQMETFLALFELVDLATFGGNKKKPIEQMLYFLGRIANISPNPFRLARIAGGMVLGLGFAPQEMGVPIDQMLINAYGEGALLYASLFDQVARDKQLAPEEVTYDIIALWPKKPVQKELPTPEVEVVVGNPDAFSNLKADDIPHMRIMIKAHKGRVQVLEQQVATRFDAGAIVEIKDIRQTIANYEARILQLEGNWPPKDTQSAAVNQGGAVHQTINVFGGNVGSIGGATLNNTANVGASIPDGLPEFYGREDHWLNVTHALSGMTPAQWRLYVPVVEQLIQGAGLRFRRDLANDPVEMARHYFMTELRPDLLLIPLGWRAPQWSPYRGETWNTNAWRQHMDGCSTIGMFRALALGVKKPVSIYSGVYGSDNVRWSFMERLSSNVDHVTSSWLRNILRCDTLPAMRAMASQYAEMDVGQWWIDM